MECGEHGTNLIRGERWTRRSSTWCRAPQRFGILKPSIHFMRFSKGEARRDVHNMAKGMVAAKPKAVFVHLRIHGVIRREDALPYTA